MQRQNENTQDLSEVKTLIPYQPAPEPKPTTPFSQTDYAFDKFIKELPFLADFYTKFKQHQDNKKQLEIFLTYQDGLLNAFVKNTKSLDEITKLKLQTFEKQAHAVQDAFLSNEATLLEMMHSFKSQFSELYVDYLNTQDHLLFIKKYLAWILHYAAGVYFNHIQQETQNKEPEDKQEKINSFNKHFIGYVQADQDGNISSVDSIYTSLCSKPLKDIEKEISTLIGKQLNTSPFWNSSKQEIFLKKINTFSLLIKAGLNLPAPPFTAYDKSLIHNAYLSFDKAILSAEENPKAKFASIETALKADKENKYGILKTLDVSEEAERINGLIQVYPELAAKLIDEKAGVLFQQLENCKSLFQKLIKLQPHASVVVKNYHYEDKKEIITEEKYSLAAPTNQLGAVLTKLFEATRESAQKLRAKSHALKKIHAELQQANEGQQTYDPFIYFQKINNELTEIETLYQIQKKSEDIQQQLQTIDDNLKTQDALQDYINEVRTEVKNTYEQNLEGEIANWGDETTRNLNTLYKQYKAELHQLYQLPKVDLESKNAAEQFKKHKTEIIDVKTKLIEHFELMKMSLMLNSKRKKLEIFKSNLAIIVNERQAYLDKTAEIPNKNALVEAQTACQTITEINAKYCDMEAQAVNLDELKEAENKLSEAAITLKKTNQKLDEQILKKQRAEKEKGLRDSGQHAPEKPPEDINLNESSDPEEDDELILLQPKSFFRQHWKKILLGTLVGAGLATIGVFTGGVVPLAAAIVIPSAVIGGGLIGGALGYGVGKVSGSPPEVPKSFLARHWKKILIGGAVGLGIAGIVVASVFTAGVAPAVFAAIGAGTAASLSACGISVGGTLGGILGVSSIIAGISTLTSTISGFVINILEGHGRVKKCVKEVNLANEISSNKDHEDDEPDHEHDVGMTHAFTAQYLQSRNQGQNNKPGSIDNVVIPTIGQTYQSVTLPPVANTPKLFPANQPSRKPYRLTLQDDGREVQAVIDYLRAKNDTQLGQKMQSLLQELERHGSVDSTRKVVNVYLSCRDEMRQVHHDMKAERSALSFT